MSRPFAQGRLARVRVLVTGAVASTPVAALAFVFVLGVLFLRTHALLNPDPLGDSDALWALRDFRDSIYYPAVAFLHGIDPYDPAAYRAVYPVHTFPLYSPLTLVLYVPLALVPFEAARWLYWGITIALYGALAAALLSCVGRRVQAASLLWLWTLILASRPGHQNLLNGQSTAQAVLGILLALHYAGRRPLLCGGGILLATLKPTFGIPIVVLLACKGHLKTMAASVLVIALAAGAVLGILAYQHGGPAGVLEALRHNLAAHGEHPNTNLVTSYSRIDLALFLSRWSGWIPTTRAELLIGVALLLTSGAALWVRNRPHVELGVCTWSSVLICFAVPLCIYHQSYDSLTLLIVVFAVLTPACMPRTPQVAMLRALVLACALAPLVNYVATDSVLHELVLGRVQWRVLTALNSSIILAGFTATLLALRRAPTRAPTMAAAAGESE
jgi:Glycosyltransferase family 87